MVSKLQIKFVLSFCLALLRAVDVHDSAGGVLQAVLRISSHAQVIVDKVEICLGLCLKLGSSLISQLDDKFITSFKLERGQEK